MIKPLYNKCIDIPTQYCSPDACGRYELCKAKRLLKMLETISLIFSTCTLLDMIDNIDEDDEGEDWKK